MSGERNTMKEMEESFALIRVEEEEGGLEYGDGTEDLSKIDTRWCLVRRFITVSTIDFQAMQHKMASLWRPRRGMSIKELDRNCYIFQFCHEVDITRVIAGSPWMFGRFQLVFERPAWNYECPQLDYRGVGLAWNIQFLTDVIRQEKHVFVFLCETIAKKGKMEWVRRKIGFDGMFVVEPRGHSGGLAFLWREMDQANLVGFSQNHIDMEITSEGMNPLRLTGMYGEPNRAHRKRTWDLLHHLGRDSNLPWVMMGNMNNVVSQEEKRGGSQYPRGLVGGFNEVLTDAGLIDMDIVGHKFTWEHGRSTNEWTEIRLDRTLTTVSWLETFPLAKVYNLKGSSSDHSPLVLKGLDSKMRDLHIQCVSNW